MAKLRAALFQKVRGVGVSGLFRFRAVVNFLLFLAAGDAVIFHAGKFANAARDRAKMFERQIEPNVAIKFAIRRIAWITLFRAPDLAARIAISRERSRAGWRETRCINTALRLRISKEQSVRIENKPANVRFLQNRIECVRVSALRQPEARRWRAKKIDICVAPDPHLRARGGV